MATIKDPQNGVKTAARVTLEMEYHGLVSAFIRTFPGSHPASGGMSEEILMTLSDSEIQNLITELRESLRAVGGVIRNR